MVPAAISPVVKPFSTIHLRPNSGQHRGPSPVKTSPSRSVMNSTPPHFTWRPKLSKATRQSLSVHASGLERGLAFRGRLLLVLVEHVLVALARAA